VKERIKFPDGDGQLVSFLLRDGKLFSFHNLKDPKGPFRDVINQKGVETIRSEQWWDDPVGRPSFILDPRFRSVIKRGLIRSFLFKEFQGHASLLAHHGARIV
jgi:hypothetical protein